MKKWPEKDIRSLISKKSGKKTKDSMNKKRDMSERHQEISKKSGKKTKDSTNKKRDMSKSAKVILYLHGGRSSSHYKSDEIR